MYKPLKEFVEQEEYEHLTVKVLQKWHSQGVLKVIRGKDNRLLTSEEWIEEAIEIKANETNKSKNRNVNVNTIAFKPKPPKNRGLNYVV